MSANKIWHMMKKIDGKLKLWQTFTINPSTSSRCKKTHFKISKYRYHLSPDVLSTKPHKTACKLPRANLKQTLSRNDAQIHCWPGGLQTSEINLRMGSPSSTWGTGRGALGSAMPSLGSCRHSMGIFTPRMQVGGTLGQNSWKIATRIFYVRTKGKNIPWNKFVLTDLTIEVKYWAETSEIDSSSHKDKSFHHFETFVFFV